MINIQKIASHKLVTMAQNITGMNYVCTVKEHGLNNY